MRRAWLQTTALLLVTACGADRVAGIRELTPYGTPDPHVAEDAVAGWGDSLTDGVGTDANYPSQLEAMLLRPVFNGGVGGETSTQILARFLADREHEGDVEVFWMGRNNFAEPATVKADIAAAVAHMRRTDRHFVVMSILNGDYPDERPGTLKYDQIMSLNAELQALYPENFLNIREALVQGGDVPPASLRADELHMNAAGNAVVAERLAAFFIERHW